MRSKTSLSLLAIVGWIGLSEPFLPQAPPLQRPSGRITLSPPSIPNPQLSQSLVLPRGQGMVLQARKRTRFLGRFRRRRENDEESTDLSRHSRKRWGQRIRRTLFATSLAASLLFNTPAAQAANAKGGKLSIRPGMTLDQIETLESRTDRESVLEELELQQQKGKKPTAVQKQAARQKKAASFDDYGDEDDEEDVLLEKEASSVIITKEALAEAAKLQDSRVDSFAFTQKEATRSLYIKVGAAFFVPTYGSMALREFVRRRREAEYIEKGLEVLKRQKAEYFNITETVSDEDVEDELKGLKNETSTDDEEEDDDDEDDDDDDEEDDDKPVQRRKPPKGPKGDGGGGSDGSGDGKPSDDDLERLNKIFGKS